MEWISVTESLPKKGQHVDLWIKGDENLISFYDPGRGRKATEGQPLSILTIC